MANNFYKTSRFDLVIISLILLLASFSILRSAWGNIGGSSEKKAALIYQGGKLLEEVDLERDKTVSLFNGAMQIEVRKGRVKVLKSRCPQHICMNMGWARYSGQTIICVPNQVAIEIKSKGAPFLDTVAY